MKIARTLLAALVLALTVTACSGESITGPRTDSSPVLGSGS